MTTDEHRYEFLGLVLEKSDQNFNKILTIAFSDLCLSVFICGLILHRLVAT